MINSKLISNRSQINLHLAAFIVALSSSILVSFLAIDYFTVELAASGVAGIILIKEIKLNSREFWAVLIVNSLLIFVTASGFNIVKTEAKEKLVSLFQSEKSTNPYFAISDTQYFSIVTEEKRNQKAVWMNSKLFWSNDCFNDKFTTPQNQKETSCELKSLNLKPFNLERKPN